jgi:hypothetical protein
MVSILHQVHIFLEVRGWRNYTAKSEGKARKIN